MLTLEAESLNTDLHGKAKVRAEAREPWLQSKPDSALS